MRLKSYILILFSTLWFPVCYGQILDTLCVVGNPSHLAVPFNLGSTYSWMVNGGQIISTPADSNDILVQWGPQAGLHSVSVIETNASGCPGDTVSALIYLTAPSLSKIQGPTQVCKGDLVTLYADGGHRFLWNDGSRTSEVDFVASHDTSFYLVTKNGPCKDDTAYHFVQVLDPPKAQINNLPDSVLMNTTLGIYYTGSPALWQDWYVDGEYYTSGESIIFDFNTPGKYKVMVVAGSAGCEDTSYADIRVYDYFKVHIPNTFTPNGDGTNDIFFFDGVGIAAFNAQIYNHWGGLVFEWNESIEGWDGTSRDGPAKEDVYLYRITVYDMNGQPHVFSGQVNLLR